MIGAITHINCLCEVTFHRARAPPPSFRPRVSTPASSCSFPRAKTPSLGRCILPVSSGFLSWEERFGGARFRGAFRARLQRAPLFDSPLEGLGVEQAVQALAMRLQPGQDLHLQARRKLLGVVAQAERRHPGRRAGSFTGPLR